MNFSSEQIEKIVSWLYKALSATVLPLLYWLNSISIENALIKNNMEVVKTQIVKMDYQIYEIKKEISEDKVIDAQTRQNLKDIEKNIDHVQKNLSEIQTILLNRENP
jgi:septal ring factor EnvC (AmiA/AmiB activator)